MVTGTLESTQQPQAHAEEDDALKRNTDCVYFLASPLTCKKGSECEYRHSEYARINPRDCWYWLNGNCLNPKCAFRHPPLDGLLGSQVATSSGSSLPSSQAAVTPVTHIAYNPGKQAVPCIFFQKGLCLKGDRCAFSHGQNPIANKALNAAGGSPVIESRSVKKVFGALEKCNHNQNLPKADVLKPVVVAPVTQSCAKAENAPLSDGVVTDKSVLGYEVTRVPPFSNGSTMSRSNHMHQADESYDQSFHIGKDADELYRESSPGFDVLVDDGLGDSEYYPDEGQFLRKGNKGRDLNEFDGRADYNFVADLDGEILRDSHGSGHMPGQYAWEQRSRASSERMLVGSAAPLLDRRGGYSKCESPDQINESDLRHHLSKQRRVNGGLRSVINHDYDEERNRPQGSESNSRCLPPHESSFSSRLRGRLKLSGRSCEVEREVDRERNFGRLSPHFSSCHQGRLRDRIKFDNEERDVPSRRMRDAILDNSYNFTGPKRLAELKVGKNAESMEEMKGEHFFLGKRKSLIYQQSEDDGDSFEGPKPLSEILKRKRGEENAIVCGSGNNDRVSKEGSITRESNSVCPWVSLSEKGSILDTVAGIKEEPVGVGEDRLLVGGHGQSCNVGELEIEDGMIADGGGMEDDHHEEAAFDQHSRGDYGQVDGGDYILEEGENAGPDDDDEEYPDDEEEDGDDFAKKIGVMFS